MKSMRFLPLALLALAACTPQSVPQASAATEPLSARHAISGLEVIPLTITTPAGTSRTFQVELARTAEEQARGLMFRQSMGADEGMLFIRNPPDFASFWMRNTVIPLDIVFIGTDHRVINIAANAVPHSLDTLDSAGLTAAVLELNGGRAAQLDIVPGSKVEW